MSPVFLGIGVGSGIGLSTAIRFAKSGFRPVLAARNVEALEPLAHEILTLSGQKSETVAVDAADPDQVIALANRYGTDVRVLHYNAAVLRAQRLQDQSIESLGSDIQVNVSGALLAIKAFAPYLVANGSGTILLTGGGLAIAPSSDYLTLSVGKAGIRCIAQALFPDLAAQGVHIATLTIAKGIAPRSEDAEAIGEAFWKLHQQPLAQWEWEAHFG